MKREKDIHELDLLLKSLDTSLNDKEKERLDRALKISEPLRKEQQAYLSVRKVLKEQHFSFSPFFVGKVLHKIQQRVDEESLMAWMWIFKRLALPALAITFIALGFIYLTEEQFSLDTISGISSLPSNDLMAQFMAQL